ncbi:DNA (cytosine-5)-methyltransferase 1 [Dietzia sp. 2505]|uniref:DNA cytosine methyltransferase n=1 Tax=Dietzia sp. 2505 TaxID=3156457 RepID=UPI00339598DF
MGSGHPLRELRRPRFGEGTGPLSVVDLFSGCGGLTLGVARAAHARGIATRLALAIDFEEAAIGVLKANFSSARAETGLVEEFFDGPNGAPPTSREQQVSRECGDVDLLIGGPPCQGHSNLNNYTRRDDPKNRLYLRMARAAEVLRPRAVLIENVPAVVHDSQNVVFQAEKFLQGAGYSVASAVVSFTDLGIPQTRKRHVILAIRKESLPDGRDVQEFLRFAPQPARDLRWAIGDLEHASTGLWIDAPARMSADNRRRIQWLIRNNEVNLPNRYRPKCHQGKHSYTSMYGRLSWNLPAQTITSGFGSLGQGRYGHPSQPRTLTAHEAARIQGFPDYFRFDAASTRSKLSVIIGNAVPPALTEALTTGLINAGVLHAADSQEITMTA